MTTKGKRMDATMETFGYIPKGKKPLQILHWFNEPDDVTGFYESSNEPSMTVPDLSLTVSQLQKRYAQGLSADGVKVPVYEGEDSPFAGIDFAKLDLAEREQIMKEAKATYKDLQQKFRDEQLTERKKEMELQVEKIVQDRMDKAQYEKSKPQQPEPGA